MSDKRLKSIHSYLKQWEQADNPAFVLQIGAMDGVDQDPIHDFLRRNHWPALLVEPVPHYFSQLEKTYKHEDNVSLRRCAITDYNGTAIMHVIDPEAIINEGLPNWARGASSLHAGRNALGWGHIQPHVIDIEVPCCTLMALIEEQGIGQIDLLQIDAEGHDYQILKQLDFSRFRPAIINLEYVNLPEHEQQATCDLLSEQGYIFEKHGYDLLAIRKNDV